MITRWQFNVFAIGLWLSCITVASAGKFDEFLKRYCYACHSGESAEAAFDLSALPTKLDSPALLVKWERVHDRVKSGEMPRLSKDNRPTSPRLHGQLAMGTRNACELGNFDPR